MNANPAEISDGNNRRYEFLYSLLWLTCVATLACLVLAWIILHRKSDIVALLQVNPSATPYNMLQSTQLSLLRSTALIRAVVTDPNISNLPLIKDQADPANWLTQSLAVSFAQKSEILEVGIRVPTRYSGQAQEVLSRVIEEYLAAATIADPTQIIKLIQPPVVTSSAW